MNNRRPRVLMTLADVAWPLDAGKRLRAESMVRSVARVCDLTLVVLFADADPHQRPIPPDVEADWTVVRPSPQHPIKAAFDLLRLRVPWQIAVQDWSLARRAVRSGSMPYDLVWFGALDHFVTLRGAVRADRMVVDCDDVETVKLRRLLDLPASEALPVADRVQRRIELPLWGAIQRRAVREADAVLVCSELDRLRLLTQSAPPHDEAAAATVVAIANTYPEPSADVARDPQGRATLVVVANYGTDQNRDAAAFVARDLLPVLQAAVPGVRVRLVGRRVDRVAEFAGIPGLDVVGPVESVAEELAHAHAVLVPIRFGGGTRLKILEAFAYGVPVISTSAGAEGIDAVDGEDLLLADTPDDIAAAVQRLLTEDGLAVRLITHGRALYERNYRPQAAAERVDALLARLLPQFDL